MATLASFSELRAFSEFTGDDAGAYSKRDAPLILRLGLTLAKPPPRAQKTREPDDGRDYEAGRDAARVQPISHAAGLSTESPFYQLRRSRFAAALNDPGVHRERDLGLV